MSDPIVCPGCTGYAKRISDLTKANDEHYATIKWLAERLSTSGREEIETAKKLISKYPQLFDRG